MGGTGPPCWPSVPAEDVPFYSRTEVLVGSAVMLALRLIVLVVLAGARWRRRRRVRQTCWRATYLTVGLSAAELDGFHDEQHGADDEVAAYGGACRVGCPLTM
jgi:hypothetical protein